MVMVDIFDHIEQTIDGGLPLSVVTTISGSQNKFDGT